MADSPPSTPPRFRSETNADAPPPASNNNNGNTPNSRGSGGGRRSRDYTSNGGMMSGSSSMHFVPSPSRPLPASASLLYRWDSKKDNDGNDDNDGAETTTADVGVKWDDDDANDEEQKDRRDGGGDDGQEPPNNNNGNRTGLLTKEEFLQAVRRHRRRMYRTHCQSLTPFKVLKKIFPCVGWMSTYNYRSDLIMDIIAGVTVACMIVPQSLSYADIAGLPQTYGLYAAFVPLLAYGIFGTSRQLSVGPVALISLVLNNGLQKITPYATFEVAPNGSETTVYNPLYIMLAMQVSFIVGIMYLGLGILRLGFVTNFLSHPVISGFTSGAAIIIGFSQVKYMLGYHIERSEHIYELLYYTFANIKQFDYRVFIMGAGFLTIILVMKYIGKKYKRLSIIRALGPLTVVVIGILVTWLARLDKYGIDIVGEVKSGVPPLTAREWLPIDTRIMPTVLSITIVGFMESIAIALALARKNEYTIDSNQELIGLGVANVLGGAFGAYPTTGSFSRSAVNNETGAKTNLAGILTSLIVLLVLLFITSAFTYLPKSALGAVVISGVTGLVDYPEAIFLARTNLLDFMVWMISFLGVLFAGVEIGLGIAVGISLLIVLYESTYPHTARLGRLPHTEVYRSVKQYPNALGLRGMVVVRFDAPLYFANAQYFQNKLAKYERQAKENEVEFDKWMVATGTSSPADVVEAAMENGEEEEEEDLESGRRLPTKSEEAASTSSSGNKHATDAESGKETVACARRTCLPCSGGGGRCRSSRCCGSGDRATNHRDCETCSPPLKYVILDMSPISHVDSTGLQALLETTENFKKRGVKLCLANPSQRVVTQLARGGVIDALPDGTYSLFVRVRDAVMACAEDAAASRVGDEVTARPEEADDDAVNRKDSGGSSGGGYPHPDIFTRQSIDDSLLDITGPSRIAIRKDSSGSYTTAFDNVVDDDSVIDEQHGGADVDPYAIEGEMPVLRRRSVLPTMLRVSSLA